MSAQNALVESALPLVLEEVRHLATASPQALAFDRGPARVAASMDGVVITGRDRVRFLHAMLSNDVQSLAPGDGVWATLNNTQGRTVTDVRILQVDTDPKTGRTLAVCERGGAARLVETLQRYVISEKVRFDLPDGQAFLWLAGAGAGRALLQAGGPDLPPRLWCHAEGTLGGATLRAIRWNRSGHDDVLLWFAEADRPAVEGALAALPELPPTALEAARAEAGIPRFGVDWTELNVPLEAGLKDRAISFTKGCYIGQEVICRLDALGTPARRLVRLAASGTLSPGDALQRDGKDAGWVTTAWTRGDGTVGALGYVKKAFLAAGTELDVGEGGPKVVVGEAV
jgi:folate-binding protein YgfZ